MCLLKSVEIKGHSRNQGTRRFEKMHLWELNLAIVPWPLLVLVKSSVKSLAFTGMPGVTYTVNKVLAISRQQPGSHLPNSP